MDNWTRKWLVATLVCIFVIVLFLSTRSLRSERWINTRGGHVWAEDPWPFRIVLGVAWANADLTDRDIRHIVILNPQYFIELRNNPRLTDTTVDQLCNVDSIFEIDVRGTSISPNGLAKLKSRFPGASINEGLWDHLEVDPRNWTVD